MGGLAVLAILGVLKLENNAKLKAQAHDATTTKGYQILNEGYLKLYQEREAIKSRADKQRRDLRALQEKNDLDGLADDFNSPGGVRHALPANPQGGAKAPARYKDAGGAGPEYEEAH
jgi:transcriptional antiterminator Rof (Rho-off)